MKKEVIKLKKLIVLILINLFCIPIYCAYEEGKGVIFNLKELHDYKSIIVIVEPQNGTIIDKSRGAAQYYGYKELTGMNINDINILSMEEIKKEMNKAENENRNYFNFKHRVSNGEIREVSVVSYPMLYGGGKVYLYQW